MKNINTLVEDICLDIQHLQYRIANKDDNLKPGAISLMKACIRNLNSCLDEIEKIEELDESRN